MNEAGIIYPTKQPQSRWLKWLVCFIFFILAFIFYWWYKIRKPEIKDTITKILSTDEQGRKIIEVTGDGGNDDGQSVQGYELPGNFKNVTFPLTVVVAPNQKIFGHFGIGEKITFTHQRDGAVIWQGAIDDASGDWIIDYPLLQQSAVGFIETT